MLDFFKDFFNESINLFKSIYKYIKFISVILLFLFSSIFQLIPIYLFNIDTNNMSDLTEIYLKLFSNIVFLVILIFIYYKDLKKHFNKIKKTNKKKLFVILDTCFRYWLIGLILMIGSNFIINKLGISISNNDANVREILNSAPLLGSLSVIFISPLVEEIVFRLSFSKIFKNKWLFIFISGIIFGSLHVIFSINNSIELLYLIPYCSLGLAFSFIYEYSDNIYISYFIHLLHNSLTTLTVFLLAGVIL